MLLVLLFWRSKRLKVRDAAEEQERKQMLTSVSDVCVAANRHVTPVLRLSLVIHSVHMRRIGEADHNPSGHICVSIYSSQIKAATVNVINHQLT